MRNSPAHALPASRNLESWRKANQIKVSRLTVITNGLIFWKRAELLCRWYRVALMRRRTTPLMLKSNHWCETSLVFAYSMAQADCSRA